MAQEIADKIGRKQGTIAEIIGNMKFHILELYLQCRTQQEIADKIGLARSRISEIIGNMKFHILEDPPRPCDLPA